MDDEVMLHELAEALQEVVAAIQRDVERLAEAMRKIINPFAECLRQALEDIKAGIIYTPRKKLPRPPRYAGPQNKGRSWTRQPQRLARSDCRKMRR
jgi:uncharacterized coiled-coil protein SlyX